MNAVNKVVKIVARREYLGFALCWLLWFVSILFPWAYKNNLVIVGQFIFVYGAFYLIRKYGN